MRNRRSTRRSLVLLILLAGMAVGASRATADITTNFQLFGATMSDGSTATGSFTYDFTTKTASNIVIYAGTTFSSSGGTVSASPNGVQGSIDSGNNSDELSIALTSPLTPTTGSSIDTNPANSFADISNDISNITLTFTGGKIIPVDFLPQTTATVAGPAGNAGWYLGPITVTLTATPGLQPVAATYYSIDGGATTTYTGPFSISSEASHYVYYWSVDTAGEAETEHFLPCSIDPNPPVTTAYTGKSTYLTATDDFSGVLATYYTVDGGVQQKYIGPLDPQPFGPHTLVYWSVDVAGNVEASHTLAITSYDVTPPTNPGMPKLVKQTPTTDTVSWTASTDPDSPVAGYDLWQEYGHSGRGGGISWKIIGSSTTNSITFTHPLGVYSYYFWVAAFDPAGNQSGKIGPISFVSYYPPTITHTVAGTETGPFGVIGGGWGVLDGPNPTALSPYVLAATGNPKPTMKVYKGPAGMTIDSTGTVHWTPAGTPGVHSATIRATNVCGHFDWTFNYTVYAAGTDILCPTAPGFPVITNITSTGATISWGASTDNVGVTGYQVTVATPSGTPSYTFSTSGASTTVNATGLTPSTGYYAHVVAQDAAGNLSASSGYAYFTTTP